MVGIPERFMTKNDAAKFKAIATAMSEKGLQHLNVLIAAAEQSTRISADLDDALEWANDILGNNDDWTTLIEDDTPACQCVEPGCPTCDLDGGA